MPITVTTRQQLAESAAERWKAEYQDYPPAPFGGKTRSPAEIGELLEDLNKPTPEAVNAIIGNDSWTKLTCDECGSDVDAVVQVGEELYFYEPRTASICLTCAKDAVSALERAK